MRTETTFFSEATYLFSSSVSNTQEISSAHKQMMTPMRNIPIFPISSLSIWSTAVPERIFSFNYMIFRANFPSSVSM
jgi:hypothetical protein